MRKLNLIILCLRKHSGGGGGGIIHINSFHSEIVLRATCGLTTYNSWEMETCPCENHIVAQGLLETIFLLLKLTTPSVKRSSEILLLLLLVELCNESRQ